MPTDQHRQSPTNYQSGHCEVGRHEACRGIYAGVTCSCEHHAGAADLPPLVAVNCFFACDHLVLDHDAEVAHRVMEEHYFEAHRAEIAVAVGWLS